MTGLAASLLALGATPGVSTAPFSTGAEWSDRMTEGEKFLSVAVPMATLIEYGVPIRMPLQAYIPTLDRVIERNPQLGKEDVANIFASTVYIYEPQTRRRLDELEERFLRGNFEKGVPELLLFPSPRA